VSGRLKLAILGQALADLLRYELGKAGDSGLEPQDYETAVSLVFSEPKVRDQILARRSDREMEQWLNQIEGALNE
jgi:hypothetical protein